jgi:hypothetical protein
VPTLLDGRVVRIDRAPDDLPADGLSEREQAERFDLKSNLAVPLSLGGRFVTGENCSPHVSTGVAPREYLDKMLAEPFEPFSFSPAGAAVYQLGPFGTAAKKHKE